MRKLNCLRWYGLIVLILTGILTVNGCDQKEKEPVAPAEIEFVQDYQTALQVAEQKNQKILIDFYTDWCYWCKVLDSATYSDTGVISMSNDIVFAKINAEVDTVTAEIYSIVGYPTIVLVNADGTEIDRIGGYVPPEEFIEEVNNYLQGIGTLADLMEKAEAGPDADLYMKIADKYSSRGMYDEAVEYFNKVIEHDPENEAGFTDDARLEIGNVYARQQNYDKASGYFNDLTMQFAGQELEKQAMFAIGDTYLRQDMYDTAHDQYQKIIKKFDRDQVASDAMFRIGYIHRERGDTADALAIYRDILEKFPESEDTTYALRYIARLTDTTQATEEE